MLILTARDDKPSTLKLLNSGADDYLSKPFDLRELLARAKALVRRGKGKPQPVLTVCDLEINWADRSLKRAGKPVDLVPMQDRVLEYLASRSRAVVSKTELLEHLYDYNWKKFRNVIEVRRIRRIMFPSRGQDSGWRLGKCCVGIISLRMSESSAKTTHSPNRRLH